MSREGQRELSLRGLGRVGPESGLGLLQGTSGVPKPSVLCDSLQQLISFWGHPVMALSRLMADIHLLSALLAALREPGGSQRLSPWGAFNLWIISSSSSKVRVSWEQIILQLLPFLYAFNTKSYFSNNVLYGRD